MFAYQCVNVQWVKRCVIGAKYLRVVTHTEYFGFTPSLTSLPFSLQSHATLWFSPAQTLFLFLYHQLFPYSPRSPPLSLTSSSRHKYYKDNISINIHWHITLDPKFIKIYHIAIHHTVVQVVPKVLYSRSLHRRSYWSANFSHGTGSVPPLIMTLREKERNFPVYHAVSIEVKKNCKYFTHKKRSYYDREKGRVWINKLYIT